jgi:hypothetical protein
MEESKLIYGYVKENEPCPYSLECGDNHCPRFNQARSNQFSCGLARAYDIIHRSNLKKKNKK